jgi:hypothetical protein
LSVESHRPDPNGPLTDRRQTHVTHSISDSNYVKIQPGVPRKILQCVSFVKELPSLCDVRLVNTLKTMAVRYLRDLPDYASNRAEKAVIMDLVTKISDGGEGTPILDSLRSGDKEAKSLIQQAVFFLLLGIYQSRAAYTERLTKHRWDRDPSKQTP